MIYVSDRLQATPAAATGDPTPTTGWQWKRNGTSIEGAVASIYTLTESDIGGQVAAEQISTNLMGAAYATSATLGPVLSFDPIALFRASEPGVWYDPSDLTTMFQDATGTTPVTAVEQPVGLILDKSRGLVLGPELVVNGDFSNGTTGWSLTASASVVASSLSVSTSVSELFARQFYATQTGKRYKITFDCTITAGSVAVYIGRVAAPELGGVFTTSGTKTAYVYVATSDGLLTIFQSSASGFAGTIDNISVRELPGAHASQTTATSRPVLSARINKLLATAALSTQSVTTRATPHTLRFEGAGSVTLSGTALGVYTAGSHSFTPTAGTLTLTVSGSVTFADLRETNEGAGLSAYQAVVTATNYDVGPAFPRYLKFDGIDDGLVTPTITPNIDKAQVFAGVRKTALATAPIILELSPVASSYNGVFVLLGDNGDAYRYAFIARGTNLQEARATSTAYLPPVTNVLTGLADISAPATTLRINSEVIATNTASPGTGNFLAYPLFIGRRNNDSLPFNGHLHSLIVRFGPTLTEAQITQTESYVNSKTEAY